MPKIKMPCCVIVKGVFTRSCPRWTCAATTETSLKGLFWLFIVRCHGEGLWRVFCVIPALGILFHAVTSDLPSR